MELRKESIIVSALRTFCKAFAGIIGLVLGAALVFFGLMMFSTPDIFPPSSSLMISADANGDRSLLPHTAPVVLKIDITGVVGQGDLTSEKIQNALLDSREGMLAHDRVKAIFLNINTPGGTVDDANGIYTSLMDYKKKYNVPVYAYVEGMCASGGMYIACAADKIYATSTSVIGSVGVVLGPTFNFSGLMDMYGVQSKTFTQGKDKDMLNPFRPWQPGEDDSIRNLMADLYAQFVGLVVAARPNLSKDKLVNDYGAQIYVAKDAEEFGYIDVADSSYDQAMTELVQAAKLSDEHHYQVMTIQPPHPFLSDLTSSKSPLLTGKITHNFKIGSQMDSELSGRFLYMYQPGLQKN